METIAGHARTGRQLLGPGSDLVEVAGKDGGRMTAIVFHPEYRGHNAINAALHVVYSFLESPMVPGLAELVAHDRDQAAFLYSTGQVWSVAEVIRTLSDLGESGGPRAGIELLHAAGTILVEAAETGENAGVYSHGGLTPWRVMLDADGQVTLIGHALPQVEILVFHEAPDRIPREDAFRYCPPERMEARRENFTSDLFGLGLIAFELMTGRPVYDGLINDIRTKAARGETSRRLQQFKDALPASVREVLTTTLRPEFRDRFQSGQEFLDAVDALRRDRSLPGAGLREVMQRVSRHQPRARQELDPARTSMLSKDELRKLAEEDDAPPPSRPARQAFAPVRAPEPVRTPEPPRLPESAPRSALAGPPTRAPRVGNPEPERLDAPVAAPSAGATTPQAGAAAELLQSSSGRGLPAARRNPRLGASVAEEPRSAPATPAFTPPAVATSIPTRTPPPDGPPAVATSIPTRTPPPDAPPSAPPTPFGTARLPPSRRPGGLDVSSAALPAPAAPVAPPVVPAAPPPSANFTPPPPVADPASMVGEILSRSGGGGREVRDRVERAMRTSGPPAPEPSPAAPARPAAGVGDYVEAETSGVRTALREDDEDPPTGPSGPAPQAVSPAVAPPAPAAPQIGRAHV